MTAPTPTAQTPTALRGRADRGIGPAAAVWLVARREVSTKLRDKGFLLSTLFIMVVILGSATIPVLAGGSSSYTVGVVGTAPELESAITAQAGAAGADVQVSRYADVGAARAAVRSGAADAAVDGGTVIVDSSLSPELGQVLDAAAAGVVARERLARSGIDAAQVTAAFDVPPLDVQPLDPNAERDQQRQVVAFVGVVVLYGLMILIGQYVAVGVVEEKSSRVVELLLATIKPWQLLAGKVLGLGLLGVAQLLIIGVVGTGTAIGFDVLVVPGDAIGTVASVVGWFILGYALYAAVFAAGASLVARQEDLQSVLLPTILVLVAAFVVSIQAAQSPDGLLARITSLVPGLSPLVMPVRAAAGNVPWWEILLAVALMLVAIVAVVRLGGRVYAGALLRTRGKVKVREALAASR